MSKSRKLNLAHASWVNGMIYAYPNIRSVKYDFCSLYLSEVSQMIQSENSRKPPKKYNFSKTAIEMSVLKTFYDPPQTQIDY